MNTARLVGFSVGAIAMTLFLLLPAIGEADEGVFNCDGLYEGDVIEGDGSFCHSSGFWRLSFETETGFFNFHFHGWTDDRECFGFKDDFSGAPEWVEELLCSECDLSVDMAETRTHVNRRGRVLVTVHGFASVCEPEPPDEEQPSIISITATDSTTVLVTFSEAMDQSSVENPFNYSIIPPLTVFAAVRDDEEWDKVRLTTHPQTPGRLYRLTINPGVMDLAGNTLATPQYGFFAGAQ